MKVVAYLAVWLNAISAFLFERFVRKALIGTLSNGNIAIVLNTWNGRFGALMDSTGFLAFSHVYMNKVKAALKEGQDIPAISVSSAEIDAFVKKHLPSSSEKELDILDGQLTIPKWAHASLIPQIQKETFLIVKSAIERGQEKPTLH